MNRKYTIKDVQESATRRGGWCLSKEYKNTNIKLELCCANGHLFKKSYRKILCGQWCPKCNCNLGEEVTRIYFEQIFGVNFINSKPDWLEGLELDGYNEKLKIAFEHQGRQHYQYVSLFHQSGKKQNTLKKQVERDRKKRKLCQNNNVKLIEIPDVFDILTLKKLPIFLEREFKKRKIIPRTMPQDVNFDLSSITWRNTDFEKFKRICKSKKIDVLGNFWPGWAQKIKVKCSICGYVWNVQAYSIKGHARWKGSGCIKCVNRINGEKRLMSVELKEKIKKLLILKKFTQKVVAEKLGIGIARVKKISKQLRNGNIKWQSS